MSLSFWWMFPVLLGVGHGLLWWLTRAPDDRRLRHVVLASFWLRIGLGCALFMISYYHWPIARALQIHDGFWSFAGDAGLYHDLAVRMADAWKHGIELPEPGMGHDYPGIIAAIYWLLGAHPLYAILLHCWFGALTGWVAYRIGARLFDRTSALRGAFFVSFWPSSLLWSSQILKDAPTWCLTLIILWLMVLLIEPDTRPFRMKVWRWGLQSAALVGAIILLTRLRIYVGSVLSLVAFVVLVPAGCTYLFNPRVGQAVSRFARAVLPLVGRAIGLGSLAALVIGAVVVARDLNTTRLFSPAHPEEGHVKLGLQHQQHGEFALAEAEFNRAIELRPDSPQAYLLWAKMLSTVNRPVEVYQVCASWSGAYSDGVMRRCLDQLEGRWGEQLIVMEPVSTEASIQQAQQPELLESARKRVPFSISKKRPVKRLLWQQNRPPEVEAGPPQTVRKPQLVRLRGEVQDDGRPTDTLSYQWTQFVGPSARLLHPTAVETEVQLSEPGAYHFRLTVSDGELTGLDELAVTMVKNRLPEVEAGPPQTVRKPQLVRLRGEVQDDGWPTHTLTYQWTQFAGPSARFLHPTSLETEVELFEVGAHHFRLTVSDGELTGLDELVVTVGGLSVLEPPTAPVTAKPGHFNAGQMILLSVGTIAAQFINRWPAIVREMSPHWLGSLRGSVVVGGGNTLVDAGTDISQPLNLIKYLPRALLIGFLAPFPWQWFDTTGSTGAMRIFSGAEIALVYLLLIGLALRAWRALRLFGLIGCARLAIQQMQLGRLFLLIYGVVMAISMSLVMANLGTLFRLRLLFWLPCLILVAAADPLGSYGWYRRLIDWMSQRRRQSDVAVVQSTEESAVPTAPVFVAGVPGDKD